MAMEAIKETTFDERTLWNRIANAVAGAVSKTGTKKRKVEMKRWGANFVTFENMGKEFAIILKEVGKDRPLTVAEVEKVMAEKGVIDPATNAQKFWDYYEQHDWTKKAGPNKREPLKNWKLAVNTWIQHGLPVRQYKGI